MKLRECNVFSRVCHSVQGKRKGVLCDHYPCSEPRHTGSPPTPAPAPAPASDMGPHCTGTPWPHTPDDMGPHCTGTPPKPQPTPDMFNLDLIVKGPTPALPWTCPNLFIMKYLRLASGRCASYWNVFLLMINPRLKLCKTYSGFG